MPLLDLSKADDSFKFNPLPEGTYNATIVDAIMREVKAGGKLPEGTPQIAVRFEIDEDEIPEPEVTKDENGNEVTTPYTKNVFSNYHIVLDKKYPTKSTMDNILYGFLKAVGYDVEELKSGKFNLEMDDLKGRKCQVHVTVSEPTERYPNPNNQVKYVKAAGEGAALI